MWLWFPSSEKQEKLEAIRQKLYAQMQQRVDDEDERTLRAMEEGEERRAREDAAKEAKMRQAYHEISEHRHDHVSIPDSLCVASTFRILISLGPE